MYKMELDNVKEINEYRKERKSGKYYILKDIPYASSEMVEKALREHKISTNRKEERQRQRQRKVY